MLTSFFFSYAINTFVIFEKRVLNIDANTDGSGISAQMPGLARTFRGLRQRARDFGSREAGHVHLSS